MRSVRGYVRLLCPKLSIATFVDFVGRWRSHWSPVCTTTLALDQSGSGRLKNQLHIISHLGSVVKSACFVAHCSKTVPPQGQGISLPSLDRFLPCPIIGRFMARFPFNVAANARFLVFRDGVSRQYRIDRRSQVFSCHGLIIPGTTVIQLTPIH